MVTIKAFAPNTLTLIQLIGIYLIGKIMTSGFYISRVSFNFLGGVKC